MSASACLEPRTVVIAAPTNVQLRRTTSTTLDVTWDAPQLPISSGPYQPTVASYWVYYSPFVDHDLERWAKVELGPFTSIELTGLDPHTDYAVQVRARSTDGRYGNFSEVVISSKLKYGMYIYIYIIFVIQ